jgi:O-antigen ligase
MTSAILTYPIRTLWKGRRGFLVVFGVCFIALFTIGVLALASWDLFQFLLGCALFFIALCCARPLSGTSSVREKEAFLAAALVIWVFLMISQVIFTHPQTTASAAAGHTDPSAIYQALSWILSFSILALITYSRPTYLRRLFVGPLKWASIFAIVAVISCPLSPKPSYSAALAFKLCVIVLTLCAIGEVIEDEIGIEKLFGALFCGTLLVVTKAFIMPFIQYDLEPWGVGGRLPMVGLSGTAGVLLLLSLLFLILKKNLIFLIFALYSAVVMMLAGNKGGMVASFVSLMAFFCFLKKPAQALAMSVALAFVLAFCLAFTPLGQSLQKYSQEGTAASGTLTGRTNLWSAAWPNIKSHILFGNGYRSSRFLSEDVPGAFQDAGNMHNSFLEVLYNNGLVGLIPILIMTVLIAYNLKDPILHPPSLQLRYYAAAALALETQLFVWGLVAVTFGGAPDDRFMTFFALLLISMFLRAQCDKKYWHRVYGKRA